MDERKTQPTASLSSPSQGKGSGLLTFQDHIQELRNRLFWVAVVFILASAAAYPFFDIILSTLVRPLGDQQLHYLTPVGGFSFILKVCMYAGVAAAVPMIIYQLFRYVEPVMGHIKRYTLLFYITASIILAATGIVLAYLISLPAALNFLTGFELPQITAMLTADSYFSFIMTYLVAAAVLFQLPLVLLIINNITPLDPGTMMKQQRYVIVVAFIIGAVISPTPDALNQVLMSGPIIIMYQLGIFLVMAQNRFRKGKKVPQKQLATSTKTYTPPVAPVQQSQPVTARPAVPVQSQPAFTSPIPRRADGTRPASFDMLSSRRSAPVQRPVPKLVPPARSLPQNPSRPIYRRSIDGFAIDA